MERKSGKPGMLVSTHLFYQQTLIVFLLFNIIFSFLTNIYTFVNLINTSMKIEVSNGEIIDKLTIIEIKLERIKDPSKLENLKKEHRVLAKAAGSIISRDDELYKSLYQINTALWDIEDTIRDYERRKEFNQGFIDTARAVYFNNDKRSEIKKQINLQTGSDLIEEKSYEEY